MKAIKSHEEKTSADKTSIGYEYQYYYFLYMLLCLEPGQKIGYEVKDDIHVEFSTGEVILMQLKHSLKTNSNNETVNLTERDVDLWKTLHNWICVINDKNQGRDSKEKQLEFIQRTRFILISNKAESDHNNFMNETAKIKNEIGTIDEFKQYLVDLESNTRKKENNTLNGVKDFMNELISQDSDWLRNFLSKLEFTLGQDDLIDKIRNKIMETFVPEVRVEDVFNCINSEIHKWKFEEVKNKGKVEIGFEEIYSRFLPCYEIGRSNKLPKREFCIVLPENILEQNFVKELLEIKDIEEDDNYEMIRFTTFKIQLAKHIETWIQKGLISQSEINKFKNDCIQKWVNIHREKHRQSKKVKISDIHDNDKEEKLYEFARNCLDEVRKLDLKLDETDLGTELSNGQFYFLSDGEEIGWKFEWEVKYKR